MLHRGRGLDGSKVLLGACGVRLHCPFTGLPAGRANLVWVLLDVLDGLKHAQGFIYTAAKSKVVDGAVLDESLLVDDEEAAQGNAIVRQHLIGRADLLLEIRDKGVLEVAKTSLLAVSLEPSQVRELRVNRDPEDLCVDGGELLIAVREGCNEEG